jgi:hypothetical protein
MPTFCVPNLSSLPGSPASDFDWWSAAPDPNLLRYYPDNPNWLGAFALSEGNGANRDKLFRVLKGNLGGTNYLLLEWVVRTSMLDTGIDRVNVLLGTGGNYVAFTAKINTASSTVAGTQNANIFTYRINSCSVAGNVISVVNPATQDGADIESTGRMWVDVVSPTRLIQTRWGFQLAIPLGANWGAPGIALNLPASGAFKMWFEIWSSVGGMGVPQQWPTTAPQTNSVLQTIPVGITEAQLMDMSTAGAGCTDGVKLTGWTNTGSREAPGGAVRSDTNTVQLDLGKPYPPNNKPYNESINPDRTNVEHQNQFFAKPTFPADLLGGANPAEIAARLAQRQSVRATFSLANWGSQYSDPTSASWRPIPGGTDVQYIDANGEAHFVWPGPAEPNGNGSFLATLVRNINKFLNNDPGNKPPGAQNPHQCMLTEISAVDPSVVITTSSTYTNMNIAGASTFRRAAEISVVGAPPISAQPRDVYLFVQKFNMPPVVPRGDGNGGDGGDRPPPDINSLANPKPIVGAATFAAAPRQTPDVEEIVGFVPSYTVHCYIDTGKKLELANKSKVAILQPQTAFGYFVQHDGDLHGWETRLYGAEKLAEDFYVVRVPNNGSVMVDTAIQARETPSEAPLPPDGDVKPPDKCKGCLAAILCFLKKLFGK